MKTFYLFFLLVLVSAISFAQNVGINSDGSAPHSSAMLDIKSTSGGLLIPRMTEEQRTQIQSPAQGLMVYQTTSPAGFYYFEGSSWSLIGGSAGSETDPVFTASPAQGITGTNITNWNSAYGWGDHASAGYLTSVSETDPVFVESAANGITGTNITNWNAAYGWGNHASVGYLTSATLSETDPVFGASAASGITGTNITNWNSAYGWGNHALAGYLSSFTETDPVFIASPAYGIDNDDISTWNGVVSSQWNTSTDDIYFNTGDVAIGTTSPGAYKLNVNGPINGTSVLVNGVAVASSTDTYWETGGSGKIYYNSGNVGIGNATPAYPLDVTGDVNITGNFRVNGAPLTGTGTVTSVSAGNGMNFTSITGSGAVTLGTPSSLTSVTTNSVSGTTHAHAITTQLPSSATAGVMLQSGAKTAGGFYGGTTAPSSITRANYDGYLYATKFYGDGSQLTGIAGSATATNLAGGVAGSIPWQSAAGTTGFTTAGTAGYILKSNGTTAPTWLQTLPVANGGTGSTTSAGARTNLGASILGGNIFTITNPSATTFPRFNADNTVSALNAVDFRTAIGAGTGGGTVTSVTGTSPISVATGTTTPVISLSTVPVTKGGTGATAAPTQGGVIYATSTSAYASTAAGTSGQVLTSNGASAPTWSSTASIGVAPVGSIMIWAGSTAPTGWLLCDGTAYTVAAYPALNAVIGTTYGTGIGFMVPNLKGKIPVGLDATQTEFDTRGEIGGEKTHAITTTEMPSHNHTFTGTAHSHTVDPASVTSSATGAHTHTVTDAYNSSELSDDANDRTVGSDATTSTTRTTSSSGDHSHTINIPSTTSSSTTATGIIGNTGSGTAMNVLQPYIVLYYIIKY